MPLQWIGDHTVSQSIYVADPDGNNVECCTSTPTQQYGGMTQRAAVATAVDLNL